MKNIIVILFLLFPCSLYAQAPTNLTADDIIYNETSGDIEATGNVVAIQGHMILRAEKLIYDASTDSIIVHGDLRLYDTIKKEEWHGSYGELSSDMRDGILNSARLIQKQKLQITAGKVKQENGRFTTMDKAVTSYCRVCTENATPFWEIRSRKVLSDNVKEKIFFEDSVFRIMGLPVLYTPYLSIPASNVTRATGFLKPTYVYDNKNGLKVFTPYFITLGNHADILFTPWIRSGGVQTIEARFREKLRFGDLNLTHSSTIDDNSKYRWFLFLNASINNLPYDFKGTLNLKKTSDSTYRSEYGFGSEDRLRNSFSANKTKSRQHIETNFIHYETLRTTENNSTMPNTIIDAEFSQRIVPKRIGGILDFKVDTRGNYRTQSDNNSSDGSSRDVIRLSNLINWKRGWNIGGGLLADVDTQLRSDSYKVYQDPNADDIKNVNPSGALALSWPLVTRRKQNIHFVEPKIQLTSANDEINLIPNEDSLLPEFDETNLFEFSRFPGVDTYEKGQRINMGLNYTFERLDAFKTAFKVGKILRASDEKQFSESTGLAGKSSDWLTSSQLNVGTNFILINRALLEDDLSILRNEMHLNWSLNALSTNSTYIWLASDPVEGRSKDSSELNLDAGYSIDDDWTLSGSLNYDFVEEESTLSNGLDLVFYNECTKASFSMTRKQISQTEKINEIAFWLEFGGFGSKADSKLSYSRICAG